MPKLPLKPKIKKTVESDETKRVSPSSTIVGNYKIDSPEYRGARLRIRQKNPRGYSGRQTDI